VEDGSPGIHREGYTTLEWGAGNLDEDPLFVDDGAWDGDTWEEGDYHLYSDSPCVDSGSNEAVPAWAETDLDGEPRISDGNEDATATVDMGVYETVESATRFSMNGGYPLANSSGHLNSNEASVYTTRNTRGDLIFLQRCKPLGTVAGRFLAGGANPSKKRDVYSQGAWASDATSIATSISRTVAEYSGPCRLHPLPGDGVFGVARSSPWNSSICMDGDGFPSSFRCNEDG